ncbi:MAG: helix-turn-helix domain-containing protein, partial [Actinomycetota bacterium]
MPKPVATRWITHEEYRDELFEKHPEMQAQWDAEVLARTFSLAVLKYRCDRGLSQTALGREIGMPQSQIARIELGEHTPSFATLLRVCDTLGLELALSIRPRGDARPAVPPDGRGVTEGSDQAVVPSAATLPSRRTATRAAWTCASSMSCVVRQSVVPSSRSPWLTSQNCRR